MFTTQVTTSNSLIKAIDIDGALIAMFNKNSLKWKGSKKLSKSGKMTAFGCFGESLWNTMKEVKTIISGSIENSIRCSTISFLQQLKMFNAPDKTMEKIEAAVPIISKIASTEVCDKFYEVLRLQCLKYKMTPPIILYGRLFEEEQFQYVAFIFGKRVFIIELATNILDVQERACETMCALIRKSGGGVPKVSSFIKVLSNFAHIVAEIDVQNETFSLCKSIPDDLEILNLNELMDLILASHYLTNQPDTQIKDIWAQTLFYKQPFLEGFYVNKCVFGCVAPSDKNIAQSQYPIVLVSCDTTTQSNFLWNDKPLTVNAKKLMSNVNCMTAKMPYHRIELLPMNVAPDSNECSGIRYGDQILYDGPLDVIFD